MAHHRLIFCLPSAEARLSFLTGKCLTPCSLMVPFRRKGKSVSKKQTKKKKDQRALDMKNFVKRREMEALMLSASLKAAKKGEPLDPEMLNPARKRSPPSLGYEERDSRTSLYKEWTRYQMTKEVERRQLLGGVVRSRERALRELRKVAPQLYCKALELNPVLFPFACKGPTETPPIPTYVPPDPDE